MSTFKQRVIDYLEKEWGTCVQRFNSLPTDEGMKRVNDMGYESFRDLLAHIVAWGEEAMPIVSATAEGRETERRKYDFDVFNAEAVAKYKAWEGERFMSHFEEVRLKTVAGLRSMNEAAFENRRIKNWLQGVVVNHARGHLFVVSRFLVEDVMEYEWAGYISSFTSMPPERQAGWLKKQGFARFQDILAHIIGWWEQGLQVISGVWSDPGFQPDDIDTDKFNAELVERYSSWSEADVFAEFEKSRRSAFEIIKKLSDEDYKNPIIAGWLVADFIEHFDEH